MDLVASVFSYVLKAVSATLFQLLIVLGPGLVLTFAMNYVTGFVERGMLLTIGRGGYLALFGWLATSVHELGHAFFCVIFRHRIVEIKLFDPDPETGTLGYVSHSYNHKSLYQLTGNFFIGIGPVLLGTAILYLFSRLLLGLDWLDGAGQNGMTSADLASWNAIWQVLTDIWRLSAGLFTRLFSPHNISSWQLYVFIYLVFAIGSSVRLSPPDIKAALGGLGVIAGILFIFNLVTVWAGDFTRGVVTGIAGYLGFFYVALFLVLVLNLAAAVIITVPRLLIRGLVHR